MGGTGADSDTFGAGSLRTAITASMISSSVRVGQDPVNGVFDDGNDVIQGGTASAIGEINIGGR